MTGALVAVLGLLALGACAAPNNPPLVSTQYPPGTGMVNANSPLQTLNSLPPGAANRGAGPLSVAPDYMSVKLRAI